MVKCHYCSRPATHVAFYSGADNIYTCVGHDSPETHPANGSDFEYEVSLFFLEQEGISAEQSETTVSK